MEVLEAIRTRRSVKRLTDQSPSRRDIEEMLEAALWAPNHHFTEPWQFHVIAGDERAKMSEHVAAAIERESTPGDEAAAAAATKARGALLAGTRGDSGDSVRERRPGAGPRGLRGLPAALSRI